MRQISPISMGAFGPEGASVAVVAVSVMPFLQRRRLYCSARFETKMAGFQRVPGNPEAMRRLSYFAERRDQIIVTIRELVEIESPSDNKAAVDRLSGVVAAKFGALGGSVKVHAVSDFGNHLQ